MITGSIHQEDITIIMYIAPNVRTPKYIKQTLTELKGETDSNIVTIGYSNIPLSVMDRTKRDR